MGVNPRNISLVKRHPLPYSVQAVLALGLLGLGGWLEREKFRLEAHRMTRFRDKSAMYGKVKAPGEPPSWGPAEPYPNWARVNLARDG